MDDLLMVSERVGFKPCHVKLLNYKHDKRALLGKVKAPGVGNLIMRDLHILVDGREMEERWYSTNKVQHIRHRDGKPFEIRVRGYQGMGQAVTCWEFEEFLSMKVDQNVKQ